MRVGVYVLSVLELLLLKANFISHYLFLYGLLLGEDAPVCTFDGACFVGRHRQDPVAGLDVAGLDLPSYAEAGALVWRRRGEDQPGLSLRNTCDHDGGRSPLNTSETQSLKGLSVDLWGGLKESEGPEINKLKKKRKNEQKKPSENHIYSKK